MMDFFYLIKKKGEIIGEPLVCEIFKWAEEADFDVLENEGIKLCNFYFPLISKRKEDDIFELFLLKDGEERGSAFQIMPWHEKSSAKGIFIGAYYGACQDYWRENEHKH